jgi:hypothetical protein
VFMGSFENEGIRKAWDSITVIAAATETPPGQRSHAVGAHVAEGHRSYRLHK